MEFCWKTGVALIDLDHGFCGPSAADLAACSPHCATKRHIGLLTESNEPSDWRMSPHRLPAVGMLPEPESLPLAHGSGLCLRNALFAL